MPRGARQKAGPDVEGEEPLLVAGSIDVLRSPLFQELSREDQSGARVVDRPGSSRQVEGVLVVGARERVQSEATIPQQIALLW